MRTMWKAFAVFFTLIAMFMVFVAYSISLGNIHADWGMALWLNILLGSLITSAFGVWGFWYLIFSNRCSEIGVKE